MKHYPDLPDTPEPTGPPRVLRVNKEGEVPCIRCKCGITCEIVIALKVKHFEGGKGYGRYCGCPACEWRSPMDVFEGDYEP